MMSDDQKASQQQMLRNKLKMSGHGWDLSQCCLLHKPSYAAIDDMLA
jgi:hypothetical protein